MVALAGFFELVEVFVQFLLLGEGDAVNPRQLFARFIPPPVSACHGRQLNGFDLARVGDMRPAAQVGELSLGVESNFAIFQLFEQFEFVLIPLFAEVGNGLLLRHFLADVGIFLARQLLHLRLNLGQVLNGESAVAEVHVVVEPIFDGRPDAKFHARIERFKRLSHEVSGGVPIGLFPAEVLPGQQFKRNIAGNGARGIPNFPVHFCSQHIARQALADGAGHIHGRYAALIGSHRTIGQGDFYFSVHRIHLFD